MKIKLPQLSKVNLRSVLLLFLSALIIYSCKKELAQSIVQPGENDPVLSEAKNWFEATYPVTALTNNTIKPASTGNKRKWSDGVGPDWSKAAIYKKNKESIIEMPLANSIIAFVVNVIDTTKINLASNYTKTSYVVSKDSTGKFRSWFMVIIADTNYVNGNFSKVAINTYKNKDPNFSGRLLYFTPKGEFLAGWRYNKGVITKTISINKETTIGIQSVNTPKVNLVDINCYSYPITAVTVQCVTAGEGANASTTCTYSYSVSYTIECIATGGGGTGSGGSGGGGGETFPPPPPPPDCPPLTVESVNGKQINLLPGDGGGGGGTSPCAVPAPPEDPCAKMKRRKQEFADANNQTKNADVLAKPGTNEWGSDIKLNSPSLSSNSKSTSISGGGSDSWQPNFTWNDIDGYAIGSVHRHQAAGPSPDDVFKLVSNLNNSDFISASASSKSFYLNNAYSTIVSGTATYVVTVSNWGILGQMHDQFNNDKDAYDNTFLAEVARYMDNGLSESSASIQAFEDIFEGAVTLYQAPAGSTGFAIVGVDANGNIIVINCP
ncbi:hypothetical protein [Mucilaginibacter sp.]|jgi:hypothetical protein|uniref:hypothetical protein n=1 Tax=Mucilaginibacter sp. TaxID=1882438 RepID=UPI0035653E6F